MVFLVAGWQVGWVLVGCCLVQLFSNLAIFAFFFFASFSVQVLSQFASATKQYRPQLVEVPLGPRMQSWQMSRLKMFHVILVVTVSWFGGRSKLC